MGEGAGELLRLEITMLFSFLYRRTHGMQWVCIWRQALLLAIGTFLLATHEFLSNKSCHAVESFIIRAINAYAIDRDRQFENP